MYKVKIYDGVTIDMGTSKIIKLGEARYVDSSDISYCKGGSKPKESVTTSGFAQEYKPQISAMLNTAQGLYDAGKLGSVAGFTPTQLAAQQAGLTSAGQQTALEGTMYDTANQGVDLSGMRTGARQSALQALGLNSAGAGRAGGLGGSRQYLNQQSIANDLAGKFGQIDLQAQQQNFSNMQNALYAQGTGAQTMAQVGAGQQLQAQNEADAAFKGLSQLASVYGGVMPKETKTVERNTGGK
tara:strand:+ start:1290 stop:2012 length:723 start_codon:yes stop_codon:yes gene_type:complete